MTQKHPEIFLVPESLHQISCDGGGALGHPKVYYPMSGGDVICRYCDRLFTTKHIPDAKPLKDKA